MVTFKKKFKMLGVLLAYLMLLQLAVPTGLLACDTGCGWDTVTGAQNVGDVPTDPSDASNPDQPPPPPNNSEDGDGDLDPVFVHQGEFVYSHQDLLIPGRGLSVEIKRTYSNQKNYNGRFGFGWNMSYNMKVKKLSNNNLLILDGTVRKDEYTYNSGTDTYTSPPGIYATIKENTDGTYTLTKKYGLKYNFDINGNLNSIVDRNSNQLTFAYDPADKLPITGTSKYFINQTSGVIAYDYKLITITDTVGRDITLDYDSNGRLHTITDFAGRIITYTYDDHDDLISVTTPSTTDYPSGLTTTYAYVDHNLTTITDAKGQTYLTNHYDTNDKVDWQTYGSGTSTVTYDEANKKTTIIDRKGFKTEYTFNDTGNPLEKKFYTAGLRTGEPEYFVTTYEYNSDMEMTRVVYARGNSVENTYDDKGNLLERRRKPLPGSSGVADIVTTFTYEPRFNFLKTLTDPRGNVTTYTYDYEDSGYVTENGNLMKITYPSVGGQTIETNFTYNTYGQVDTAIDPNGNVTKYEYYSPTGYLWKIINGFEVLNYTTEMTYDSVGNMTSIKNPRGYTTSFTYDSLNKLTQTTATAPFSYVTKYAYDENGNLKQVDRQSGDTGNPWITTIYTYNNLDKLLTTTDELGNVTTLGYDNNDNRTSITDAEGKVTAYEYDERDLLWKMTNAGGHVTEYAYDLNGNLKTIKDAKNNETNYAFDDFERLKTTTYPDNITKKYEYDASNNLTKMTNQQNQEIVYAYDELNRLDLKTYPDSSTVDYVFDAGSRMTSVTDSNGTITYSFDEVNRVESVTYPGSKVVSYEYDSNGNRTKLTYPDSDYITYVYDELNRLDQIKNATAQTIVDYTYDDLSRRTQLDHLNGTRATYSYDAINRLTDLDNKVTTPETLISGFSYDYDKVGNRKYVIHGHESNKGDVYVYDNIYQLTNVKYSVIEPVAESTTPGSSTFDSQMTFNFDNLGNRTSTVNGGTTTYTSNNMNQYTDVGGSTYSYDNNGNLTSDGTNTYQYDYENRLTQAITSSDTITFRYDAFGRRIEKNVAGQITKFIYDGDQVTMETDNAGTTTAKYVYGTGIDEVLTMNRGGNTYYYHFDSLGSVTNISDSSGNNVESYGYNVYGKASIKDGTGSPLAESAVENLYMFTGRRFDKESGLYYYRSRYYKTEIGRFLQTDHIGYWADFNLYRYCGNNPLNWVDPWGLEANVTLTGKGKVKIEIPIEYKGPGASKEVIDKFNTGIKENWSGKFGKYDVEVEVVSPKKDGKHNVITVPEGNGRAYVQNGSTGEWPAERPAWTAAHEAGHLMGLPDYYDYNTNKPINGWDGNIMSTHGGKPEERNITELLGNQGINTNADEKEPGSTGKLK